MSATSTTIIVGGLTGNRRVTAVIQRDVLVDRLILDLTGSAHGSLFVTTCRLGQVDERNGIGKRSHQERHQYECMYQSVEDVSRHERIKAESDSEVQVRMRPYYVVEI